VKEGILQIGDEILSESRAGGYYKVVKTVWWAKEKAIEAMDKFMDLARRGFPEKETKDFVDNQEKRYAWEYYGPSIDLPPEGGEVQ